MTRSMVLRHVVWCQKLIKEGWEPCDLEFFAKQDWFGRYYWLNHDTVQH